MIMWLVAVFAVILEATNLWRWDFSGGFTITTSQMGAGVGGIGGGFGNFGANIPIRPGSLNSNMAMQSYCRQYPRDCSDVMALITGINPFFGNHIFGLIMLVVHLIAVSVAVVHSIFMYRRFKRDYSPGGKPPKPEEAPLKDKVGYQVWNVRTTISNWGKETKEKLLDMIQRDPDEEEVQKPDPPPSSVGVQIVDERHLDDEQFYDDDEFSDYSDSVKTGLYSDSHPPSYFPPSPSTIVKHKHYDDDDVDRRSRHSRHRDDRSSHKSQHSSSHHHHRSKRRDRRTDEEHNPGSETFKPDEHYASVVV